ncbi:MAG: right-handed parallel beta-helix repeat-containing protein [Crocinitomicaceae bacterium]|nr:right-handed parallel beta-helix repeat-containing protein [Crocinitomicaceae bacterium]
MRKGTPFSKLLFIWGILVSSAIAEQLILKDTSDVVLDGKTYDRLIIDNCKNIVVKNCTFNAVDHYGDAYSACVKVQGGSDNIIIQDSRMLGNYKICDGIYVQESTNVTAKNNYLSEFRNDGLKVHSASKVSYLNNEVHGLLSQGTDGYNLSEGPCYGHSDLIQFKFEVSNIVIDGNLMYGNKWGNAGIFFGNNDSKKNIRISNNIIISSKEAVTVKNADGVEIYNNIFWGQRERGLELNGENNSSDPAFAKNIKIYNNIMGNFTVLHSLDLEENNIEEDFNLFGSTSGHKNLGENSFIDVDYSFSGIGNHKKHHPDSVYWQQFEPKFDDKVVDAGKVGGNLPLVDLMNRIRDEFPDIGPLEFDVSIEGPFSLVNDKFKSKMPKIAFNRFSNSLNYNWPGQTHFSLFVLDIRGTVLSSTEVLNSGAGQLPLGKEVKPGFYLIQLSSGSEHHIQKIIVL